VHGESCNISQQSVSYWMNLLQKDTIQSVFLVIDQTTLFCSLLQDNINGKPQSTFCVRVRAWPHSGIRIWVLSFWTLRTLGY
jgi:hypothetical protein